MLVIRSQLKFSDMDFLDDADDWTEQTGRTTAASEAEMRSVVESANLSNTWQDKAEELHWHPEEELLVVRTQPATQTSSQSMQVVRSCFLFVALVSVALGLLHSANLRLQLLANPSP